jgi:hypothetical protein
MGVLSGRLGVVLVLVTVAGAGDARAQAPAPTEMSALRQDMQAVRKSVDELVVVMRQFLAESSRRDRITVLLRRIEVAEKQADSLAAELRLARTELLSLERNGQQARDRAQSARSMAGLDRTGAGAPLLQQDHDRALMDEQTAQQAASVVQGRINDLENELAARRTQIRTFEQQLEKEWTPPRQ